MFLKLESLMCVLKTHINRTHFLLSIFVCGLGLGRHVYVGTPPTLGIANQLSSSIKSINQSNLCVNKFKESVNVVLIKIIGVAVFGFRSAAIMTWWRKVLTNVLYILSARFIFIEGHKIHVTSKNASCLYFILLFFPLVCSIFLIIRLLYIISFKK